MFSASSLPTGAMVKSPTTIWLDPEKLAGGLLTQPVEALAEADPPLGTLEAQQWQHYLNSLALLGFNQWLQSFTPAQPINQTHCLSRSETIYNSRLNAFKITLIVKEHILDEVAVVPEAAIKQSDLTAHFYVLVEVLEEEQQVTIRGVLRYDHLCHYVSQTPECLQIDGYNVPLSIFDLEPNHLLFYCEFLAPAAIPLPDCADQRLAAAADTTKVKSVHQGDRILIGQWLKGILTEGWQGIETLFDTQSALAWQTRNQTPGEKRGKLINFGLELEGYKAVLLVNVTAAEDEKLSVLVQLHPADGTRYLCPELALSLKSATGNPLQTVLSRSHDNYIQLKPFKGKPKTAFSIVVQLGETAVEEAFEI